MTLPPMPHADIVLALALETAMGSEKLPIAKRDQIAVHFADLYPQGLHAAGERCRSTMENPDFDTEVTATALSIIDQAIAVAEGRPWTGDD